MRNRSRNSSWTESTIFPASCTVAVPETEMWPVSTTRPDVTVHTCRSCTPRTSEIDRIASATSCGRTSSGVPSRMIRTESRSSRAVLAPIRITMKTAIKGSKMKRFVAAIARAPETTPTDPRVSPYAWRNAPRMLMFRRAERPRRVMMARFSARPASPTRNIVPPATAWGCANRPYTAKARDDAIAARSTESMKAARTSIRWYPNDICGVCGRPAIRRPARLRPNATASVPTCPASLRRASEPLQTLPEASTRAAVTAIPRAAARRRSNLRRGPWASVALPLPVEILLPLYPRIDVSVKAVVLGLGKAVGAIFVFYVGHKVNPIIERWMGRHPFGARILKILETVVRKTGWIGLVILLAIPFMSDTAVNYFYSLLNEEGTAIGRWPFIIANLIGGIVRTYLFLWLLPG